MTRFVGAIDQGTTSSRFAVVDHRGRIAALAQREHEQIYPNPGWVEHDASEIWANTEAVILEALGEGGLTASDFAAVGITNQRETTVVWERESGRPVANAVVWQDTRTAELCRRLGGEAGADRFRATTGLPLATYFSGPKIRWLLEHGVATEALAEAGELAFGTMDSWVAWNLTGEHVTDVTNASRTLLMDLHRLEWSAELLDALGVPAPLLPRIVSSSEVLGECRGVLGGVPLAGILGDQQSALFGQAGFDPGQAKNTYGTGCFLLLNTGATPRPSAEGLLTTVAYRLGTDQARYALEGSIAVTGAAVQWLRDNLGLIDTAAEVEELASSVRDNGGVYFVPAFSGLFAPYWRSDARGVVVGLTRYADRGHLARAVLEATAYQTRDVLTAMERESGVSLSTLKVDGGMVANDLLMQFQADILGVPVVRPRVTETTVLGAAYAAGLAVGYWSGTEELASHWEKDVAFEPRMDEGRRNELYADWQKAVERSFGWVDE